MRWTKNGASIQSKERRAQCGWFFSKRYEQAMESVTMSTKFNRQLMNKNSGRFHQNRPMCWRRNGFDIVLTSRKIGLKWIFVLILTCSILNQFSVLTPIVVETTLFLARQHSTNLWLKEVWPCIWRNCVLLIVHIASAAADNMWRSRKIYFSDFNRKVVT